MMDTHTLQIELMEIEPPIWRKVVVPSDYSLGDIHVVIQIVMGWQNSHLHRFVAKDRSWSYSDPSFEMEGTSDEYDILLSEVAPGKGATFLYEYDMGDYWQHRVKVVETSARDDDQVLTCLAGARACPPEDVGGSSGYETFLAAIADPGDELHEHYSEWMPDGFDPEAFDVADVNARLEGAQSWEDDDDDWDGDDDDEDWDDDEDD